MLVRLGLYTILYGMVLIAAALQYTGPDATTSTGICTLLLLVYYFRCFLLIWVLLYLRGTLHLLALGAASSSRSRKTESGSFSFNS